MGMTGKIQQKRRDEADGVIREIFEKLDGVELEEMYRALKPEEREKLLKGVNGDG